MCAYQCLCLVTKSFKRKCDALKENVMAKFKVYTFCEESFNKCIFITCVCYYGTCSNYGDCNYYLYSVPLVVYMHVNNLVIVCLMYL